MENKKIRTLTSQADYINKIAQAEFKKQLVIKREDIDIILSDPNIRFETGIIRFALEAMKFIPKSDHSRWTDFIGESRVLFEFIKSDRFKTDKQLEAEIKDKIKKALKVIKALSENCVFQEENKCMWIKVI